MIAPERERERAPEKRATPRGGAEPAFAIVDELLLGRVPAGPAERARELLAAPDWREQLAALLRDDPTFRTAIAIASTGLQPVVERVLAGAPLDERAAVRVLAYAVRMSTRTTPFGTFASVGPVAFDANERYVDDARARVAQANVDHEWLVGAVDALAERAVANGDDLLVASATALRREGPRFALLDERKVVTDAEATQYRSVTIAATPPVVFSLERARAGCSVDTLARALAAEFSVDIERARSLLRKLVDARFLIPAARTATRTPASTSPGASSSPTPGAATSATSSTPSAPTPTSASSSPPT
jgi:hypothetical protein